MEALRTKILPLLKGNQLLSDWFLQLFPTEKAPDSSYFNYETLYMKRNPMDTEGNSNKKDLSYERIPTSEITPDPETTSCCGLKYLHGRLFYGHRILLPARLSFLVLESLHAAEIDEHLVMEDDESNQPVECVHNTHELDKSHSENEGNSSHSGDDEDDDLINNDSENSKSPTKEKFPIKERHEKMNESFDENSYVLCDESQLKTHAIRLNPSSIYSHSYSDNEMMDQNMREDSSDSSLKGSPKRQHQNLLPLFGTKQSGKNSVSPNSKKMKSPESHPTTMKLDSPIKSNSPALLMAKKLKSLTEEESSNDERPLNERIKEFQKIKAKDNLKPICEINEDSESDYESSIEIIKNHKRLKKRVSGKKVSNDAKFKKQKIPESQIIPSSSSEAVEILANPESSVVPVSTSTSTSTLKLSPVKTSDIWTRDEDKIILEAIEQGYSSEEDLINKVENKLNRRGHREIGRRYQFLMNVLKQFQSQT